jgi:hypothetical protein
MSKPNDLPKPIPARPKRKPRKYLNVIEGSTFTVEEVNSLISQGFTHYTFPDGATPAVLPIKGWKCLGEKLIYDEYMCQFMWMPIMEKDWVPIDPHKPKPS